MARVDERLVTPEGVRLDLVSATVATRALGRLVDLLLQVVAVSAISIGSVQVAGESASEVAVTVVVVLAVFLVRVAYPVVFESRLGATIGHMALGLRVLSLDGSPVRARQALARAAVGLFEIEATVGLVALLVSASRHDGRRLGDLAGGTQVVRVRVGDARTAPAVAAPVPTALRGWLDGVDLAGLGGPERRALQRYAERAAALRPERRDEVARPLLDALLTRLAVVPPSGLGPHEVLMVLASAGAARATAAAASTRPEQPVPPTDEPGPGQDGTGFAPPG